MPEGKKTKHRKELRTRGPLGVVAEVRQRAAVDSIVCVCRVETPQEVTHMSEMKASITDCVGVWK